MKHSSQISTVFLRTIVPVVGALPLSFRRVLGAAGGYAYSLFPSRERVCARAQLRRFLKISNPEPLVRKMFANLGVTLLESLNLAPILQSPESFEIDDPALVNEILQTRRAAVALTGHIGNWDLLAAHMVSRGVPLSVVGRAARSPALQDLLSTLRARYGVQTIWRGSRSNELAQIIRALRENRTIGALIDQDTRVSGIPVPLFGTPAMVPRVLVDLAKRANARIVAVALVRLPGQRYRICIKELSGSEETPDILARYHHFLEGIIRLYPDQWVWHHKRWRTLPDGTRLSSRKYLEYLETGS